MMNHKILMKIEKTTGLQSNRNIIHLADFQFNNKVPYLEVLFWNL